MKRVLALVLALTLVFALAACRGNGEDETTTDTTVGEVDAGVGGVDETNASGETGSSDATDASGVTGDASSPDSTNQNVETVTPPTKADGSISVPSGSSAIASYFNEVVAYAVNSKAGYTKTRNTKLSGPIAYEGIDTLKSMLDGLGINLDGVIGDFIGVGSSNETVKKGTNSTALKKTSITAADVRSNSTATLSSDGKYIDLKIYLVDARNPEKNNGSSIARLTNDITTPSEVHAALKEIKVNDSITIRGTAQSVNAAYKNIVVTARVDAATKRVVSINYSFAFDANLNGINLKWLFVNITASGAGTAETVVDYKNFVW